jgi:acetyl esterase/lipase
VIIASTHTETGTAAWQQPFSAVAALPSRKPDYLLEYGPTPEQRIEVWLPRELADRPPVVVMIHGGCWMQDYNVGHVYPLATALANHGFSVWAPEYRRIGHEGGGWPGTFEDIAEAVDRMAGAQHPFGDPTRTVLVGHSAGGQLALWAAGRTRLRTTDLLHKASPFVPKAVLGLAAITDLASYAQGDSSCQRMTQRLMGGMPQEYPNRYAQASPTELGLAVPSVLLHGDADSIVPFGHAGAVTSARIRRIGGAGHFDLIHPLTPAFPMLLEELEALLT